MCGIAGFIERAGNSPPLSRDSRLKNMTTKLLHRGPDGFGHWMSEGAKWNVALGHRRLSIIDLEGGAQPMASADDSLRISFNGEIYNFRELRAEHESQGYRFHTRSDTEVILAEFANHGEGALRRLNGMFAFAIWDEKRGELTLARDRAGIKPLYYASLPGGGIAFASELSALIMHPQVERKLDADAIREYFFSDAIHPPRTILESVRKLAPGHSLVWRDGGLAELHAFWSVSELSPSRAVPLDEDALAGELIERLEASVERQLVADVPVGIFLSGGIDSSLIAALAARKTHEKIHTFSIGFEAAGFDESGYARLMAERLGSVHTEAVLNEAKMLAVIDEALDCLDEPMADPSILPTWLLARLTASSVKVALGGDGGDELWAGYPTYRAHRYARVYGRLPRILKNEFLPGVIAKLPVGDGYQPLDWKLKRFANRWSDNATLRHRRWMSSTDLPDVDRALGGNWKPDAGPVGGDELDSLLKLDFTTYLPDCVLTKVDRATMAHGLEARPPMLDAEFVEWSFSIPSPFKLRGTTGKYLLKRAAARVIPEAIAYREKKGFGIPLAQWLRGPLRPRVAEVIRDSPFWGSGIGSRAIFAEWSKEHFDQRVDRSKPLWALLVLDHWLRKEGFAGSSSKD